MTGVLFLILDWVGTTTLIAEGRGSKYSYTHRRGSRKFAKGFEPTFFSKIAKTLKNRSLIDRLKRGLHRIGNISAI